MSKGKFAVVGCQHSHITMFIEEMQALGYECAGIYERDPMPVAAALAKTYGLPLYTPSDYAQLEIWQDKTVGIVGSTAINSEKINIVELCAVHGKSIMLDKPAAIDRDGYNRLAAVIDSGSIQVGMLFTERVNPALYTLQRLNAEGRFGHIVHMAFRKPHRLAELHRPGWFFDKALNGGLVTDLLIHDFDTLRWVLGQEIKSSSGYLGKSILPEQATFYDTVNLQTVMEGGMVAQLYADWHTPDACWAWGDMRIFITGTEASAELRLSGDPLISDKALLFLITNEEPWSEVPLDEVPYTICADFIARIDGHAGHKAVITHQDILAATKAAIDADEAVTRIRGF
ncbi:Gfo/Idh/MocA family protein [Paenibacillus eucommiae]|uniref:Dehydrogenase n=1 Tax=Paenibacillus eucommiae TaxID=1355755 RepID=A0ABS4ISH1_9BACL|nr:Gfo/Idh/MocA family oxidoreductase [Paenibacillus eucommiae]MBP1990522.1 putative dehydrogenase [Paenibacillus eucommiae]